MLFSFKDVSLPKECIREFAYAKINLCLRVLGKREDGYHDIESLVLPVNLSDRIAVSRTETGRITIKCPGHSELENEGNLCVKAAKWYFEKTSIDPAEQGIEIVLEKEIPIGAGMGGGSTDAAAVLRILQKLYCFPIANDAIKEECWVIGADVPVCFESKPRWIYGVGEKLGDVIEIDKLFILLINPGYEVSTRLVYESYNKNLDNARLTNTCFSGRKSQRKIDRQAVKELLHNDLESVTMRLHPDLLQMKDALHDANAERVLMTGSGPTLFALFESEEAATVAKRQLERKFPESGIWLATNFLREE